jgi:hypothetical protein
MVPDSFFRRGCTKSLMIAFHASWSGTEGYVEQGLTSWRLSHPVAAESYPVPSAEFSERIYLVAAHQFPLTSLQHEC